MTNDSVPGANEPQKEPKKTLKEISIESNLISIKSLFWDTRKHRYSKNKIVTVAQCADLWHVSLEKAQRMLEEIKKAGFISTERTNTQ